METPELPDTAATPVESSIADCSVPTLAPSRWRSFASTRLGHVLAGLALLSVFVSKQITSHRAVAVPLLVWALVYGGYYLWARGAKFQARTYKGIDAVRERQRWQRNGD